MEEKDEKEKKEEKENNNKYLSTIPNIHNEEEQINQKFYPNILYRKNIKYDSEPPQFKKNEDRAKELVRYSNAVLLYTVKEKRKISYTF